MGVPGIPGTNQGTGNSSYRWGYSNKSASLRFGSLVALSLLPSASPLDVVLPFEVQSGVLVAGDIVGLNTTAGPENTLTTSLAQDGAGVQSMSIASGNGRGLFILSPNQTVTAAQPFLIPDPANPGNVIVMPVGSGVPPVGRALAYLTTGASEAYIEAEFMPGLSAGLSANPGQLIMAEAVDAVVAARYIPRYGNHTNPAAAVNTPILYRARTATRITVVQADLAVAPGGGAGTDGVRYSFKVGATPQAANAAAATTAVDITGAAIQGVPNGSGTQPTSFIMPANTVLVCLTSGLGAGVGAAEHSMISFRAQ